MKRMAAVALAAAILAALPAYSAYEARKAVISNAFLGSGSMPYQIVEDDSIGDQCVKIVYTDSDPDTYRLEGAWFVEDGMKKICEVETRPVYLREGNIEVFCAPKCADVWQADEPVVFYGNVLPVTPSE